MTQREEITWLRSEVNRMKQVMACQLETIEELSEELAKTKARQIVRDIKFPQNGTANLTLRILI